MAPSSSIARCHASSRTDSPASARFRSAGATPGGWDPSRFSRAAPSRTASWFISLPGPPAATLAPGPAVVGIVLCPAWPGDVDQVVRRLRTRPGPAADPGHDLGRQVPELHPPVVGGPAEYRESPLRIDLGLGHDDPEGLVDDRPGAQRLVELLGQVPGPRVPGHGHDGGRGGRDEQRDQPLVEPAEAVSVAVCSGSAPRAAGHRSPGRPRGSCAGPLPWPGW